MDQLVKVQGMHCASCAAIIEKTLTKNKDVKNVSVNYASETAQLNFDSQQTNLEKLSAELKPYGYGLSIDKLKDENDSLKLKELKNTKTILQITIPLAVISLLMMGWDIAATFNLLPIMPEVWKIFFHHLLPIMASIVLALAGQPYLLGLYRFIRYGKANMDTLIGLGTVTAFLYSFIITAFENVLKPYLHSDFTYYDITIIVIVFINLGKYLEMRSKLKTGEAIEKLLNLQAKTALVRRNNLEQEIPLNEVVHDDIIIVKPGEKIPVDGIIIEGSAYIDENMITGEPLAVSKNINDQVVGGTINTTKTFTFKATKIGQETMLAHIIKMVEEAQASKAPIQALADKISGIFVPIILAIALITIASWLIIGPGHLGFSQSLSYGLMSFVSVLVIACPCALGLATPTAIIVGVGKGAREGILIKDAASLQKLQTVNVIIFDKTGTITKGQPELTDLKNFSDQADTEIIKLAASLETKSEHPLAMAILNYAKEKNISLAETTEFEIIKGQGLKAKINNELYYLGNTKLLNNLKIAFAENYLLTETKKGKTPIILSNQTQVLAIIMVADTIKPEAKLAINFLKQHHIEPILLTGDNQTTANYIANEVGIEKFFAEMLPDQKLEKISELQKAGFKVAMTGDGINDAPALAKADIGIAMATGTDVAIESAGITLLHGDIAKLIKAIKLSNFTMRGIKQNLFWAFIYNLVGIPLAAGFFYPFFGWLLNPIFAGLAMSLSSVSVVGNSLRLKTKKL